MNVPRYSLDADGSSRADSAADMEKLLAGPALRRLPRVLVLGAQGSGTSAALEAAGLRRLAGRQPSGWTCWAGERIVAVETPESPPPHGKTPTTARKAWKAHLAALQRGRPSSPLDGIVAMVPLPSRETTEASPQMAPLRALIDETESLLGRKLPIAVVFTHADVLDGFGEFFQSAGKDRHDAAPGIWEPQPRPYTSSWGEAAFDRICATLGAVAPARMEEARETRMRAAVFVFPTVFGATKSAVLGTLGTLAGTSPFLGFGFVSASDRSPFLRHFFASTLPAVGRPAGHSRRRSRTLRIAGLAVAAVASAALLTGWGVIFARERTLIAETRQVVAGLNADTAPVLQTASVSSPDFENILEPLAALHDMPARPAVSGQPAAWTRWLGLSQRDSLATAADVAYGQALQRLLRPRLMLALRESVAAGLREPEELYQPLKAYLMLGGGAPIVDGGLIAGWAAQNWDRRYPGSANRSGRDQLNTHLEAMLSLNADLPPSHLLDRGLIETAQRALARMDMPDQALALIRSSTYSATLPDFSLTDAAGPHAAALFETSDGRGLAALSVPGLYTAAGFQFFLHELASVAHRLKEDQWVMGAGGQAAGAEERLRRLGPDLLDRYSREFMGAWTEMLDGLRLKPLSAGEPDYPALAAASDANSPLRSLVEAVAMETEVTAAAVSADAGDEAAAGLALIGLAAPSSKSQSRAGSAFRTDFTSPGVTIEARFRPFRILVAGPSGQRPIDILLRNLSEIRQSLQAGDEGHSGRLQLQVLNLRTNASRLPPPFAGMFQDAADAFESAVVEASVSQLDQLLETTVGAACRAALADAFPFGRGGSRELTLPDFARLFGPNGEFDRFFAQNLAALVDVTGPDWRWRPNMRFGRDLPPEVPRSFQRAMEIRDAFFRAGSSTPGVSLTFRPGTLSKDAEMALLDVGGTLIHVYPDGNVPTSLTWPQLGMDGASSLSLTPAIGGRQSALRFEGPWSLLRLIAAGTRSVTSDGVEIRFVIGGRNVTFTVTSDAALNLLSLPLLEEFKCPSGL